MSTWLAAANAVDHPAIVTGAERTRTRSTPANTTCPTEEGATTAVAAESINASSGVEYRGAAAGLTQDPRAVGLEQAAAASRTAAVAAAKGDGPSAKAAAAGKVAPTATPIESKAAYRARPRAAEDAGVFFVSLDFPDQDRMGFRVTEAVRD